MSDKIYDSMNEMISKSHRRLDALATLAGIASGQLSHAFLELQADAEVPEPYKNRTLRQIAESLLKMDGIWMEQYDSHLVSDSLLAELKLYSNAGK